MLPSRLSAVTLVTDDVMARRGFYEALGWHTPLAPRDDYARFETAGAALSIWTSTEAREEIGEPLRRAGFPFPGFTLAVAVERDELVDEAAETARAAGAPIVGEPEDHRDRVLDRQRDLDDRGAAGQPDRRAEGAVAPLLHARHGGGGHAGCRRSCAYRARSLAFARKLPAKR